MSDNTTIDESDEKYEITQKKAFELSKKCFLNQAPHPCDELRVVENIFQLLWKQEDLKAKLEKAKEGLKKSRLKGHNDTCSQSLIDTCECDCGYKIARETLKEIGDE